MKRMLDIQKVDAALKRAAQRALHGTRAERSGRFLPARKRPSSEGSEAAQLRRRKA